ncbi:MAG: LytR/AlgR family response regulator transcription factor, partial [Dorea sp.]
MKVAVCDDNINFLEEMKGILEKNGHVRSVKIFSSPLELVLQVTEETDFDLIFMNLDWKSEEKSGFQWGEEIYELRPNIPIIFITGNNDCFAQRVLLAKANILGYMIKPVDTDILNKYLEKAQEQRMEAKYLVLSKQSGKISLLLEDIIHIESHNHKAIVHTE